MIRELVPCDQFNVHGRGHWKEMSENKVQSGQGKKKSAVKLCNPLVKKWPDIPVEVDQKIQEILSSIFLKYQKCLRQIKKRPKWKKLKDGETDDFLTEEEEAQRKLFKSWFVVGLQTVIRGLENDRLRLVLITKETQPVVLKTAVLELVSRRNCPAVCVSDVLPAVKQGWTSLSSLTAIGILKTDTPNDFDALVVYVQENIPSIEANSIPVSQSITVEPRAATACTSVVSPDAPCRSAEVKGETLNKELDIAEQNKALSSVLAKERAVTASEKSIDPTKYYVFKGDVETDLKFDGQGFIRFGEGQEHIINSRVEIVNGCKLETEQDSKGKNFGIAPSPLSYAENQQYGHSASKGEIITCKGVKRKQVPAETGGSTYRSISMKNMKSGDKVKKPRQKNKCKKGKKAK